VLNNKSPLLYMYLIMKRRISRIACSPFRVLVPISMHPCFLSLIFILIHLNLCTSHRHSLRANIFYVSVERFPNHIAEVEDDYILINVVRTLVKGI
jgi:hypothetical protein